MCHALLDVPACYAGYRQPCIDQARTDGGGGEKESSVPELCSLESVCGQACVYRRPYNIARPGVSLPPYLSTISTAAVVSSTS